MSLFTKILLECQQISSSNKDCRLSVSNIRDKKFQLMISKSVLIMGFGLAKARSRQAEALSLYPYTRFLHFYHFNCHSKLIVNLSELMISVCCNDCT